MSHIASYKSKIVLERVAEEGVPLQQDPGWHLLREALETLADELGGEVTDYIYDYFGRQRKCDLALITPLFPRGVGIEVRRTTGEVMFLYDDYGDYQGASRHLCDRIMQSFAALAVARAFQTLNYEVEMEQGRNRYGERTILVRGVQ